MLASSASLMTVIVATAVIAATAAALTGAPPGIGWSRWEILASLGVGVALLAYLGGVIAASLLSSPLGAVLLGAVLGAVPAVIAAELTFFVYARVGNVFLGPVLAILLLPAYVVASWLSFCRGEPAGRGRIRRAVTVLGATLAGVLALFVILAPIAIRANASLGQHRITSTPSGGSAFVSAMTDTAGGGGWIIDAVTGAKRCFVPPPVREVVFSPEGGKVAILTWSGPLGSVRSRERIDIRSAADGNLAKSIPIPGESVVLSMIWADGGLVVIVSRETEGKKHQAEVEIADPATGVMRPTGYRSDAGYSMLLIGPTQDGRVFVSELVERKTADGVNRPVGFHLYPIDVAAARVGPALVDGSGRAPLFGGWGGSLSPGGRYARVVAGDDDLKAARILDLKAGADRPAVPAPPHARWLSGDRLVWHDELDHRTRLFVGMPGAPPKALREWRDAQVGIEPSPDGHALFVSVIPGAGAAGGDADHRPPDAALFEGSAPEGSAPEELVYLPDEDRFLPAAPPFSGRTSDKRYSQWAGPRTLARIAPGVVFLEDIGALGKRRFVIGRPANLE
jgi:hypothetical protein